MTAKPAFAAIVRTTGARPQGLDEALQSIRLQELACVPVVVVHGGAEVLERVRGRCPGVTLLHAPDTSRRLGYPMNIGLRHCLQDPAIQYVFLLDDDDVIYPFFTRVMADAFEATASDVIYARSNKREPGVSPVAAFAQRGPEYLAHENFIANNGFAVRASALRECGVMAGEHMQYLDDWHFLLHLLEAGLRFHPFADTLSEFRIVKDADLVHRRDMETWKANREAVRAYVNRTSFRMPGSALALQSVGLGSSPEEGSRVADQLRIAALRKRVEELESSLSWRWMAPARRILGAWLRLTRGGRARQ
ncbi:MAG: glycosyltransferase family A protein [Bryobacteraceae bacterium]